MAEQAYKMSVQSRLQTKMLTCDTPNDVLDEFAEQCVLIADILRADDAKEASKWNEASLNDDDEEDENENEDQEDEDQEDEALIAALANSLTSSPSPSSSPGGEDDAYPDDDEEAVISALAGSLR